MADRCSARDARAQIQRGVVVRAPSDPASDSRCVLCYRQTPQADGTSSWLRVTYSTCWRHDLHCELLQGRRCRIRALSPCARPLVTVSAQTGSLMAGCHPGSRAPPALGSSCSSSVTGEGRAHKATRCLPQKGAQSALAGVLVFGDRSLQNRGLPSLHWQRYVQGVVSGADAVMRAPARWRRGETTVDGMRSASCVLARAHAHTHAHALSHRWCDWQVRSVRRQMARQRSPA